MLNSGLLHVRGGVSFSTLNTAASEKSSPRPWRCFPAQAPQAAVPVVFSTSVEVFPTRSTGSPKTTCLLHVRGGVSIGRRNLVNRPRSSPRPWRCFSGKVTELCAQSVFSTSVEVFPTRSTTTMMQLSLLHVRGGVSERDARGGTRYTSSPRPWRCFHHGLVHFGTEQVFSTSVEVFPKDFRFRQRRYGLLHVRGGVSAVRTCGFAYLPSSPRPWRCCYLAAQAFFSQSVFSTSVEVFPTR